MLALSQSAVSAALTDLEGQLGVQLFDRVGKRLVVNEHGRLLYPRALALLEQAVEIEQLFREDNGAIRIYASSTIGNYILPAVIARYRHDYPQLPIELSVGNSQDVMQAVLDFRVDIGFIEGPCHSTEIISEPWLEDELVVFAAPTSPLARGPVTLEQLAAAPWILRERGSGTREIVDYLLLSHLPKFEMAMELGNSEAIKHAVRHGLGISCLSRRVIEDQLQAGTLSEVAVPLPRLIVRCGVYIIGKNTFPTRYGAFWTIAIPRMYRVKLLYKNMLVLCRFRDAAPSACIRQKRDWLLYL